MLSLFAVNMPDPIWKHFHCSQKSAIRASTQPECMQLDHIYASSDIPCMIGFCFSKESLDYIVQNWPGFDLGGLARFWPNASDPLGPVLAECN